MIKTGLLWIPALEESTDAVLRTYLAGNAPHCLIIEEARAGQQKEVIAERLRQWSDEAELDLILTIGGTLPAPGPAEREQVPAATLAVLERRLPGLSEIMRQTVLEENLLALLDCGVAGIRGRTIILNLPMGPDSTIMFLDAVVETIEVIHLHLIDDEDAPTIEDGLDAILDVNDEMDEMAYDEAADEADDEDGDRSTPGGLDAGEFAEFLARKRDDDTQK